MRLLYLILMFAIAAMWLPQGTAYAATSAEVTITASPGNISEECASDFAITLVSLYEIQLSWVNATGGNVTGIIIKAAYDRSPSSPTDGFEIYNGNGTSTTHWINTEAITIGIGIYYKGWATLVGGGYSACYIEGIVAGGATVANMSSMFIFIAPAAIAALGIFGARRRYPLIVAAGILWLSLSIWFIAQSGDPADLSNILGWVGIALGIALVLAPLWMPSKGEFGPAITEELKEEVKEESYGDRQRKWEKDSGLRSRRSKYAAEE